MNGKMFAVALALGLAVSPATLLAQQAQAQGQPAGAELPAAPMGDFGRQFVREAAEGNLLEVMLAGMAKTSAESQNVRQFAERMLRDHSEANERLEVIAKSHQVEWPEYATPAAQELTAELDNLPPEKLDKAYMEQMVQRHEQDVQKYREARDKVDNPELGGYIDTTLEILEAHLVLARAIRDGANVDELGPEVQPGG